MFTFAYVYSFHFVHSATVFGPPTVNRHSAMPEGMTTQFFTLIHNIIAKQFTQFPTTQQSTIRFYYNKLNHVFLCLTWFGLSSKIFSSLNPCVIFTKFKCSSFHLFHCVHWGIWALTFCLFVYSVCIWLSWQSSLWLWFCSMILKSPLLKCIGRVQ